MIPTPLTYAERTALGIRARKQLARSAHSAFSLAACSKTPLELLFAVERTRLQPLIAIKHQRMAASPFGFFRGAVPIMAADLAAHPNTGLTTQLCGDAHVLNLGAYAAPDGHLAFDINDFDETIHGPFEWDVKRMATAILLAGRESGIGRSARRAAVETFLTQYRISMRQFAVMPVLELARHQIHRLANIPAIANIERAAARSTPAKTLTKLTQPATDNRVAHPSAASSRKGGVADVKAAATTRTFRNNPPLLYPLPAAEAELVLATLGPYLRTLQPERRHFLAQYRAIDVGFKVVGTGSVGLRDYCIYFDGPGSAAKRPNGRPARIDPLFLQVKEEPASAYAPYLPEGDTHTHQGHRVVDGQRAMQLTSDPFLGYTTIEGRDFLVRQLNDHKAGLDLTGLTAAGLEGYADVCGELLARGHARAGDPVAIAAYLGNSARFDTAILTFARAYADKTEHDHDLLVKWMKQSKPIRQSTKPAKKKAAKGPKARPIKAQAKGLGNRTN
jgi:uncharacterized protein (DUF2252 family)